MLPDDRAEALMQLEIIEANGLALGDILENMIDTLDMGRSSSRPEPKQDIGKKIGLGPQPDSVDPKETTDFSQMMEQVVIDALALESKSRRVQGGLPMEDVEVILEVVPRQRGGWCMTDDFRPLARYV